MLGAIGLMDVQVSPTLMKLAVPVAMLVIVKLAVPVLVSVTDWVL